MKFSRIVKNVTEWLRPDLPGPDPLPLSAARALTDRTSFTSLLSYRDMDERNFMHLDNGIQPAVGFVMAINPMMIAGVDAEAQLEALFLACPADTIVQIGSLCTPQVESFVNQWAVARLEKNTNPLLRQIAMQRREFMLKTATGPSMLPEARLHPRMMQWYVSVRVPFKGDLADKTEINAFLKSVEDLRNTMQGALRSIGVGSEMLQEAELKFLLREILNPQLTPQERVAFNAPDVPLNRDIVDPNSRITVGHEGVIQFASGNEEPAVSVACITTDAAPKGLTLPMMAAVLGAPDSPDDRITCPYWAYTTVHVLDAESSRDRLQATLGMLNKQTMSESPWYRSMMGHMFERRDVTQAVLKQTGNGHRLVRAYAGINIYCPPSELKGQTEYVKGLWRRAGFRVSEEKFISMPVFIASLPLQYNAQMESASKGLQRAWMMTSINAASLSMIQGDWRGTGASNGGPLFVSRKGQLATFDLLKTQINYNFVVIAASGSGKSFLTNEIVCDFLSKNGIARIIDVGRSYYRFCNRVGGQNIVFSPDSPVSLNPFSGIHTQDDLNEMMPMLKDLLRLMAYPLTAEADTPAFQYQILEKAIQEAWLLKNEQAELQDVHAWLLQYNDPQHRTNDLAVQLEPYAVGRYKRWFSGPRTVSFDNPLVVIELEELKQDTNLQAVVLQLMIHQVTKEMYLSDRKIPKLLAIDEAWDLLGNVKTGKFIETSFRRARKYNGIAGVITQSFEDFEKSEAARAAIENAAWQFILYQRPESLEFALANKRIVGGESTVNLLRTVRSGKGFSEVFVRGESGTGLYRFVSDRHSYYTFTTNPNDINKIQDLVNAGKSLPEAIDTLAQADYLKMWGEEVKATEPV